MTKGLSEGGDYPLEFRGAEHEETRARLALMEAALLSEMHSAGPLTEAESSVDTDLKDRILSKLGEVDD